MTKSRPKAAVYPAESKKDLDSLEALVVEIQELDSQKTKLLKSFKKNLSTFTKKFCKDASGKMIDSLYVSGLEIKIEHEEFIDIYINVQKAGDYEPRLRWSDGLLVSEPADREDFCDYFESKKDAKALIATFQKFMNLYWCCLYDAFGESVVEINKNGQIDYPG